METINYTCMITKDLIEQLTSRPPRRENSYPSPTPYLPVLSSFVPLWVPENTAVENETYWVMEAEPEGGGDDDDEDDDDWEIPLPPYPPPPPPQEDHHTDGV